MKVRDSGMPAEDMWETFFDPQKILSTLAFDNPLAEVIDFGCGYGTFAIAAARLTKGTVYALDIDAEMVRVTAQRGASLGLSNLKAIQRDFVTAGSGLPSESTDYAMLFNILHAEDPVRLTLEAFRSLRFAGKAAVIHWVHGDTTPRGPDLAIRPHPEQCRQWLRDAGFHILVPELSLPPYHYGVVGEKRRA